MSDKKPLSFGETPWDDLDKKEMLLCLKRMYSALRSCSSVLEMQMAGESEGRFWSVEGVGGKAVLKSREVLNSMPSDEDLEPCTVKDGSAK